MSIKNILEESIRNNSAEIQARLAAIQELIYAYKKQAEQIHTQADQNANLNFHQAVDRINAEFKAVQTKVLTELKSKIPAADLEVLAWESSNWSHYQPYMNGLPPEFIRIGELIAGNIITPLPAMPALVPLRLHGNWIINADEQSLRAAVGLVNSTAWRIAAFTKPGMVKFILLDPHDLGGNLASLRSLPKEVRGAEIYYQEDEMARVLAEIAKEIADTKQNKLSKHNISVEKYNERFPDMPIFYRFLIITGFPVGFNAQSLESLRQILFSGPEAGIYSIILQKTNIKLPYDFNAVTFFAKCFQINMVGSSRGQVTNDVDLQGMELKLDIPPAADRCVLISNFVERLAPSAVSSTVDFLKIAERKVNWWKASSAKGLTIDLGKDESGQLHRLELGATAIHALIGGATGYGKSTMLHEMILMLATRYGPDQVQFYLVDFKEGVEFEDYVVQNLPHACAVVVEAEREFGISVLDSIIQEMEIRGKKFKSAGVAGIEAYVAKTKEALPRIILIVDEFIQFFEVDDQIADLAQQKLGNLIRLGRAFGIHIILAAQRPICTFVSTNEIRSQIGLRMAMKTFLPEDSEMILGEGNYAAAQLDANRKGLACVTIDPYRKEATCKVQTAYLSPKIRKAYLEEITLCARNHKFQRQQPMIVFHKKDPVLWTENTRIKNRLSSNSWRAVVDPFFYLGEPIRILPDHILATLKSDTDENLIIDGKDTALAQRILISSLLGLMVSSSPERSQIVFVNHNDQRDPFNQIIETLKRNSGFKMEVLSGRDANQNIMELGKELERRENTPGASGQNIFLFINGVHRWNSIRSRDKFIPSDAGEQLLNLIQRGSQNGIHVLCWTDRLESLARVVGINPSDVAMSFSHRVALQMDDDESIQILGNMLAKKLPVDCDRAYYQECAGGPMEKFKPYTLPITDEIHSIAQLICKKWEQK